MQCSLLFFGTLPALRVRLNAVSADYNPRVLPAITRDVSVNGHSSNPSGPCRARSGKRTARKTSRHAAATDARSRSRANAKRRSFARCSQTWPLPVPFCRRLAFPQRILDKSWILGCGLSAATVAGNKWRQRWWSNRYFLWRLFEKSASKQMRQSRMPGAIGGQARWARAAFRASFTLSLVNFRA